MSDLRGTPTRYLVDRAHITGLLGDTPRYRVDQVWSGLYQQCRPLDGLTRYRARCARHLRRPCRWRSTR